MKTIVLEMERLRNPYSGLGQYCLQLGRALAEQPMPEALHFECYLPEQMKGILGAAFSYRITRKWHKLTGVTSKATLWHCLQQDSEYFPVGGKTGVAMTIHDLNFLERTDYSGWRKSIKTSRLQKKINRCQGLVYISEYVKNAVHDHLNVPEGMVEQVIYNGVHIGKANGPSKLAGDKPYLFSIGIHPKKNYTVALPILEANPGYQWVIAGADSKGYQAMLAADAAKLGLSAQLIFTGPVSEEEKWALYQGCSALMFPSLSEGFGLPVLEAMAFGKPVFLSERTSLPEIGGAEAYYFKNFEPEHIQKVFADGMRHFNSSPENQQRLKNRAAKFTWGNAAKGYLQFYSKILSLPNN